MEFGTIIYPLCILPVQTEPFLAMQVSIAGSAKANCVPLDTTMLNVTLTELDIVPAITFEAPLNDRTYSNINVGLSTIVEEIPEYIAGQLL